MYGAWISKNEVIPVENYEDHDGIALEIIQKVLKCRPLHIEPTKYSAYRVLLRLNYIRVKYYKNNMEIIDISNYYPYGKFTEFQKEIINKSIYKDFTHLYGRQMDEIMELNKKENGW